MAGLVQEFQHEIEHALIHRAKLGSEIGAAGYVVAFAVAASNLRLGSLVM